MTNYPVADFLIRLKNAVLAGKKDVSVKKTKLIVAVANTLKKEKYLETVEDKDGKVFVTLSIYAKKPVITDIKVISKPGRRVYIDVDTLEKKRTPEIYVISTPKGVMSDKDALKQRTGGELIAKVL